ncbi:anaphase-promoting complex, subunit 10 (APC10) domain-containing protein [Sarocladium implicatum]|nr:anaphase-promoting complex, subunit 10 (APC10) domain-containing protein [Sarocladium implicatum]
MSTIAEMSFPVVHKVGASAPCQKFDLSPLDLESSEKHCRSCWKSMYINTDLYSFAEMSKSSSQPQGSIQTILARAHYFLLHARITHPRVTTHTTRPLSNMPSYIDLYKVTSTLAPAGEWQAYQPKRIYKPHVHIDQVSKRERSLRFSWLVKSPESKVASGLSDSAHEEDPHDLCHFLLDEATDVGEVIEGDEESIARDMKLLSEPEVQEGLYQRQLQRLYDELDKMEAEAKERKKKQRTSRHGTRTDGLASPPNRSHTQPDLSILAMARGPIGAVAATPEQQQQLQRIQQMQAAEEAMAQEQYEAEDTSVEEQVDEEVETEEEGDEDAEDYEDGPQLGDPAAAGLKEISNLGKFTVSSHKPGNGVEELRNDDTKQNLLTCSNRSDGPQPHRLTVYFVKRVGIRDIRFYVNYNEDESYTPTKIVFKSGTSENNLIEFASMSLESPVGWQQVPIAGAGGDPDGNTLVSYVLQMQILENHQNGKDTHLRGIKIYAFDGDSPQGAAAAAAAAAATNGGGLPTLSKDIKAEKEVMDEPTAVEGARQRLSLSSIARSLAVTRLDLGTEGLTIPDYMREPELR